MKALSILQPWAYLIVEGHKDIENRTRQTHFRGRFLVHAGKGFDLEGWRAMRSWVPSLPNVEDFQRGGIVGAVDLVNCLRHHPSKWKHPEAWGYVLANPERLPFRPYRGQLGFFEVPEVS